jgi:hypothetical protein
MSRRREPTAAGSQRRRQGPDEGLREVALGPYLDGTVPEIATSVGAHRGDGLSMLYQGKEHLIFGEHECGKSMFAVLCAVAEIERGHDVSYVHFEEDDPADTIERLRAFGAKDADVRDYFHFYAPERPLTRDDIDVILDERPSLVIADGYNEALALHHMGINDADGIAAFRTTFCRPLCRGRAAVLLTDHVVKDSGSRGDYPYGSVHKLNGLTGAALLMVNAEPFGLDRHGASHLYVIKDRPGTLRRNGRPPRKGKGRRFYLATLIIDAAEEETEVTLTSADSAPDLPNGEGNGNGNGHGNAGGSKREPGLTEEELIRRLDDLGTPDGCGFDQARGLLVDRYHQAGATKTLKAAVATRKARRMGGSE